MKPVFSDAWVEIQCMPVQHASILTSIMPYIENEYNMESAQKINKKRGKTSFHNSLVNVETFRSDHLSETCDLDISKAIYF